MLCKICCQHVKTAFKTKILQRYQTEILKCDQCGFMQFEDPFWTPEAYANPINSEDIGLLSRGFHNAKLTKSVIRFLFNQEKQFVDFGAGYGVFVRIMRDNGFDFYGKDKYCTGQFAKDFFISEPTTQVFELLTAFEVFEHLVNPCLELESMLTLSESILFSTCLIPLRSVNKPDWWYYGFQHGQHISFFTLKSLKIIAEKHGLFLSTDHKTLHLFTRKKVSQEIFRIVCNSKVATIIDLIAKRNTLIEQDYKLSLEKHREPRSE